MKKVLIITPYYPPFPRVGSTKRLVNFVKNLPEYGWEPVVVTMDWGYKGAPTYDGVKIYSTVNFARASWNAYMSIDMGERFSFSTRARRLLMSTLRTAKNWLLLPDELILWKLPAMRAIQKAVEKEKPAALFVSAPPFSPMLIGAAAGIRTGLPVLQDVRDDWNGNPLTEKKQPILQRRERKMQNWVVRNSSAIVTMTEASRNLWKSLHPEMTNRIHMIPNGFNDTEMRDVQAFPFAGFAMVHAGSLEAGRSPETVFKAIAGIHRKSPALVFHQYGIALREYREMASSLGIIDRVQFENMINERDAIARIKGANLLVLLPTQNAPTAIPGKAYEYVRSGRPILLVSAPNATTALLGRFKNVFHVLPGNVDACRKIIEDALAGLLIAGDKVDTTEIMQFDRRHLTGKVAELLHLLTKDGQ